MHHRIRRTGACLGLSAVALLGTACGPTDQELRVVDSIRREYPELSVATASDDELLSMADATCSRNGLTGSQRQRAEDLGIDVGRLTELADPLCATR